MKQTIHIATDLGETFRTTLTAYATVVEPQQDEPRTTDRGAAADHDRAEALPAPLATRPAGRQPVGHMSRVACFDRSAWNGLTYDSALTLHAAAGIIRPLFFSFSSDRMLHAAAVVLTRRAASCAPISRW